MSQSDILIVDDNPANLDLLSGLLREHGFRFRVTTSGRRAITAAQTSRPALIMLDITMPDMDGYAVCTELKADPRTCQIPVIFISALDEAMDKVKAFRAGAADYVAKPFHFEEVMARIEHQLQIANLKTDLELRNSELIAKNELLEAVSRDLQKANDELASLSMTDALTGIPNRRQFHKVIEAEWSRAQRSGQPLAVMMIDVDFFKLYNDAYGHQLGDDCLTRIARALRIGLNRAGDFIGRYGGEEFVAILPNVDTEAARDHGKRLCEYVRELAIPHSGSVVAEIVTVSIGFAATAPTLDRTPTTIVAAADLALYEAKRRGRNRVICATDPQMEAGNAG